jgi:mono/diheme cytochrome c family protein
MRVWLRWTVAAALAAGIPAAAHADAAAPALDFNRDVRPILAKNCFACHGPDEGHREAGLRLDLREEAIKAQKDGVLAIVPGHPERSDVVRRIAASPFTGARMPPDGDPLTKEQVGVLTRWIAAGAPYQKHWSFERPTRPALPHVNRADWLSNPVDAFILAKLDTAKMAPSAEADRAALIRRVSLDLSGLPPTPDQVDAFVADRNPAAYARLVDRLLADPTFGERWARPWLDLARYADSKGYASDPLRTIWLYRDWVIDAFNDNMPFDKFTIEQIAGDLVPHPSNEDLIATAFHRNTMTNTEGGTDDEEYRVAALKDRVDTTMEVWMGLTIGCAKCHTHKFDPITQKEYYQFLAIFNQTADRDLPDESPTLDFPTPAVAKRRAAIDAKIATLKKQLDAATTKRSLQREISKLEKSKPALVSVPVMRDLPRDKQRKSRVMIKGNFLVLGDEVGPGVPAYFGALNHRAPLDRMALARWLVDRRNPLTARVAVNRIWSQLFGQGIVETEEDFGTQGKLPSHPELLDWLAIEFMHGGWDAKALVRLLVTSATYRQSAQVTADGLAKDPHNRLLGRAPRLRLEAEMIRDQALALSGLLSHKMKGPSVFPPQPEGLWRAAFNGSDRTWKTSQGPDRYRRGLYTFWRRTIPYPSLATFDAPSRETCSIRRVRTNTPLQAFVTLNDPAYVEAAQGLARRIVREGGSSANDRCRFALRLCVAHAPRPKQVAALLDLFEAERNHYQADAKSARLLANASTTQSTAPNSNAPNSNDRDSDAELAAWTVVANVLLNLDGVLTKG